MVDAPPSTPTKEDEAKKLAAAATATTPTAGANAKKFEGDGVAFKAKFIGMEDLSVDRDEKICLDSMFKLKAVAKARGEHKQRVQLNLTMSAVKVIDDTTKAQIATHEIERISFVVIDPRDTRAFGYIYNTSDDRHQFWAIKTERSAAVTVLALKELFEAAFELYTKQQKDGTEGAKAPASSPVSPATAAIAQTAVETPVTPPQPAVSQPTSPSLLDDSAWGDAPSTTSTPLVIQAPPRPAPPAAASMSTDLWDVSPAVAAPPAAAARKDDSLDDIFSSMPAPAPSTNTNAMFNSLSFPPPAPAPVMNNFYPNMFPQPMPAAFPNTNPMMAQQQQQMMPAAFPNPTPMMPPQQLLSPSSIFPQQDLLAAAPITPNAPPTLTNPMNDFGFLDLSSPPVIKPNKDAFFPNAIPNKSIQQLQAEKKP